MGNPNNLKDFNKKILIVEDETSLLEALSTKLEGVGFSILQAKDGVLGLSVALKNHPDIIILDILLPAMDGLTMLDNLRKDAWGKNAKVIILTNLSINDERLSKVILDQPSYYLVKSDNTLEGILEKVDIVLNTKKEGDMQ